MVKKMNLSKLNLHNLSRSGNIQKIKLLIESDPENINDYINEKNDVGYTPLHYASFYGHLPAVKLFYEYDADLNIVNNSGKNPFFLAVEANRIEIVKYLLSISDISIADKNGFTVLHMAIVNGNFEMVKLLMSSNTEDEIWVDINAIGREVYGAYTTGLIGSREFSVLDYSIRYKRDEIKDFLFGGGEREEREREEGSNIIIREIFS